MVREISYQEVPLPPDFTVLAYVAYFVCSVLITVWVGLSLHGHGCFFLVDAFHGNEPLADSVNHLLLVGFYLLNIGAVLQGTLGLGPYWRTPHRAAAGPPAPLWPSIRDSRRDVR